MKPDFKNINFRESSKKNRNIESWEKDNLIEKDWETPEHILVKPVYTEEDLKNIFTKIGISWDSIFQVKETIPDLWGERWNDHLEKEKVADTLGN